jgi:hypothetical protein
MKATYDPKTDTLTFEPEFGITIIREKRYSPQVIIGKAAKLERIPWIGNCCFVMWTTIVE